MGSNIPTATNRARSGASQAPAELCLTNNRTSPQHTNKIPDNYVLVTSYNNINVFKSDIHKINQFKAQLSRKELAKEKFKMRPYASSFCSAQKIASFDVRNSKLSFTKTIPSRCKSWSCPDCAPHNAIRVRKLIEQVVLLNDLQYFFTLTLNPEKIPDEYKDNTHKYITSLFNKLMLYLKRELKLKKSLKYIWVMEYQKNGNAHLHGMWNLRLDVNVIRRIWVNVGGGQQMVIGKAKDMTKTARYVSKYLSKSLTSPHFYYFQKRYAISLSCVRKKTKTISSSYLWEDLVYHSYSLARAYLNEVIDPDDEYPSISFNFYDPKENKSKVIDT